MPAVVLRVARFLRAEKDEPLQLVLMCSTAAGLEQAKKLASNLLDTIRTDWEKYRCAPLLRELPLHEKAVRTCS